MSDTQVSNGGEKPRKFVYVKRFKRGAYWNDGDPRMCVRCAVEVSYGRRSQRRQAVVTAIDVTGDSKFNVGYCDEHVPEELEGRG